MGAPKTFKRWMIAFCASYKIHEKMNLIFGKLKNTLIFSKLKKRSESNFTYYDLYWRKLTVIARKKYALLFSIRLLDFSLQIRKGTSKCVCNLGKSWHSILIKKLEKQQKSGFSNLSVHFPFFFWLFFFQVFKSQL